MHFLNPPHRQGMYTRIAAHLSSSSASILSWPAQLCTTLSSWSVGSACSVARGGVSLPLARNDCGGRDNRTGFGSKAHLDIQWVGWR